MKPAVPPSSGLWTRVHYSPIPLVVMPGFLPLLLLPDPGPRVCGPAQNGDDMAVSHQQSEAILRGARMLRTALGPAIAGFLEDPSVVEVMLNPDGRLWIDRLSEGLSDTGERLSPADGERIVRLVAHHVGAAVHSGSPRVSAARSEEHTSELQSLMHI